jgi:alpha-L-fucosidase
MRCLKGSVAAAVLLSALASAARGDGRNLLPLDQTAVPARADAIDAWRDLRFGLFIHWGPVALKGVEIGWSRGAQVPVAEYDALYKRFNPVKFNADEWVAVAKAAGMKYIVLTTKHHDGFCLWDTKQTAYNIMNTPFGRDVVKELSQACRRGGIRFGAYYSTCDWYHPDFPLTSPGGRVRRQTHNLDRYTDFLKAQVHELLVNYGPLLCLWHDVPQIFDARRGAGVINLERAVQPDILINNRTGHRGDFSTPEQRVGTFNLERPWETCMTICRQWAWKPDDHMKSLKSCISALVRTIGGDGNFLFNVGPQPDGLIEPRQVARLKEIGAWVARNAEAVYGTRGGPWKPSAQMAATRRGRAVYLHFLAAQNSPVVLDGLPVAVTSAQVLGGPSVPVSTAADGTLLLSLPDDAWDPVATVVKLTLAGDAMRVPPLSPLGWAPLRGATATASAVYGNNPAYAPSKAIDGDLSTRWATPAGTAPCWLRIDFDSPRSFRGLHLQEECCAPTSRVRAFTVDALCRGVWKTVFTGTTIGADAKILFAPVTATAVRLSIREATNGPTFSAVSIIPH